MKKKNTAATRRIAVKKENERAKTVKKSNIVLTIRSPLSIRKDFNIALGSIRKDVSSANYVDWESMNEEETKILLRSVINGKYTFSYDSPDFLRNNLEVVLSVIQRDTRSLEYIPSEISNLPQIDNAVYKNFASYELQYRPIINYADKGMIKQIFSQYKIFTGDNTSYLEMRNKTTLLMRDLYIDRLSSLYAAAIKTYPTIEMFKNILKECTELQWDNYRTNNADNFSNLFSKITSSLRNESLLVAKASLPFLSRMKTILGDKGALLDSAMNEYFDILHKRKKGDIDLSRNTISELCAQYVAICKETFKKHKLEENLKEIKKMYVVRKDNSQLYKKMVEYKQLKEFRELAEYNYDEVCEFLCGINEEVDFDKSIVDIMISNFIYEKESKLDSFMKAPDRFSDYKRYLEACKLVNRLNSKYINYTDNELERYSDIIKYNEETKEYYYCGPVFSGEDIEKYEFYMKEEQVFDKIKQIIIFKAKEMYPDIEVTDRDYELIKNELPFRDDYFVIDEDYLNKNFSVGDFINCCLECQKRNYKLINMDSILDDRAYELLRKFVIDYGILWMLMAEREFKSSLSDIEFDSNSILSSFNYMKNAVELVDALGLDIKNVSDMLFVSQLASVADVRTLAILGSDVVFKLSKFRSLTDNSKPREIIKAAIELACKMCTRSRSTVPYVSGKVNGYNYSMYDVLDPKFLISGIETDACFKINGSDNDFLHYCALDKNGFILKITNDKGELIGRAAGFRNGNAVYINQLRTIYDKAQEGYMGKVGVEKDNIIAAFTKACEHMIEESHNEHFEETKIDYVFVTQSYLLSKVKSNVSESLKKIIGEKPMDCKSNDWIKFCNNTKNLIDVKEHDMFYTDYGNYDLICVASSKSIDLTKRVNILNKLKRDIIRKKDVPALHYRKRNNIIVTSEANDEIIKKINRVRAINSYLNDKPYLPIDVSDGLTYYVGDNWYVVMNSEDIGKGEGIRGDLASGVEYCKVVEIINDSIKNKTADAEEKVLKLSKKRFN